MASTSPDRFGDIRRFEATGGEWSITLMNIGDAVRIVLTKDWSMYAPGYIGRWSGIEHGDWEKIEPKVRDA